MNIEFLFYLFATVTVFAALRVITSRNPLHAVLFLVLAFVSSAGIWMLLEAEFLAIALVLVYVGAVMVLFLFVVKMLDINIERMRMGFLRWLPLGLLLGGQHIPLRVFKGQQAHPQMRIDLALDGGVVELRPNFHPHLVRQPVAGLFEDVIQVAHQHHTTLGKSVSNLPHEGRQQDEGHNE